MNMKTLITGHMGFVGQHILKQIPNVIGFEDLSGLIYLNEWERIINFLEEAQPEAVIHLAAQSNVPYAFLHPRETYETNFLGTLNLLMALDKIKFKGKFLYISSGDVYGLVDEKALPVIETLYPKPRNPYAVSKVATEALCYQFSQTASFSIVVARSFNHVGPGQSADFVISHIAKSIVEVKLGLRDYIEVGDIDITRDFTDVRDVIQAYCQLLEKGENGEIYNVCSGREILLRDLLLLLQKLAKVSVRIQSSSARFRPTEQRRICGSFEKLHKTTGWVPEIAIEKTLGDILQYWEKKLCQNMP